LSSILLSPCSVSPLFTLIVFLAFAVKLPIYGLHFWLPMAHVEAPTFGSIILAGVLLKLGGVGLLRFLPFLDIFFLRSHFLSYFMLFFFISSLVCCFQSDFKRLVAYSSVSHMIAVPLLLIRHLTLGTKSMLIVIIFHGLSSPVMFILVGLVYSFFGTRQLVITRGLLLLSPLLAFVIILSFFYTLSAPPYPSFIAEVFFFISVFSVSSLVFIPYLLFIFFSLVYNLN
jgi:NADH:ubiquinone oxidoreductase subunit 4 (subunit M)